MHTIRPSPVLLALPVLAVVFIGCGGEEGPTEPPVPTKLAFVEQPSAAEGAQPMTTAVQVAVQDASGNTVAAATHPVTLVLGANPVEGALSGTLTQVATQGIAAFPDLRIDRPGSGYTLVASSPGLTGATSTPFTVTLTFAAVSGGDAHHTCGLTSGGAAYCWGANESGQLGDGTTTLRTGPVLVLGGLTHNGLSVAGAHTCGVTTAGTAYCWGNNGTGQLGDGTTTERSNPETVLGGLTFATVNTGVAHTCGATAGGTAYCWGANGTGGLGDGTTIQRLSPVPVSGGLTFDAVSAAGYYTCGVTTQGTGYCWGANGAGELGDGTTTQRLSPVPVSGGLTFAEVSSGGSYRNHACGLTTGGAAYCWGANEAGEVGSGSVTFSETSPVAVVGGITFASISAGGAHNCGLTTDGAAYCWGYNGMGQLGDGTTTQKSSPVAVSGGLTFTTVIAGGSYTCGVTADGIAYCWGSNASGELGNGTTTGPQQCAPAGTALACSTTPVAVGAG